MFFDYRYHYYLKKSFKSAIFNNIIFNFLWIFSQSCNDISYTFSDTYFIFLLIIYHSIFMCCNLRWFQLVLFVFFFDYLLRFFILVLYLVLNSLLFSFNRWYSYPFWFYKLIAFVFYLFIFLPLLYHPLIWISLSL